MGARGVGTYDSRLADGPRRSVNEICMRRGRRRRRRRNIV